MRKFFMLLCMILFAVQMSMAQAVSIGNEGFEGGTHTFTVSGWTISTDYAVSGTKSMWGAVPNLTGDSVVLTSPIYDFTNYSYVAFRFFQICKVSILDEVRVEYRLDALGASGNWQPIPNASYSGAATNYGTTGFNAASYSDWQVADSLVIPSPSWWKEEIFDLSNELSLDRGQIRFVLKKNATTMTQINYGWLIDNVQMLASNTEIINPVVEFVAPFVKDTLYSTGPYTIRAKVATRSSAPIVAPYLAYTQTLNGVSHTDSILMTAYSGDSLWQATLPQFVQNTSVVYSVYGRDTSYNYSVATSGYTIVRYSGGATSGTVVVGDTTWTGTSNYTPYMYNYDYSWSRQIYLANEISASSAGGLIQKIAFYATTIGSGSIDNQAIYFKATSATVAGTTAYVDPLTDGATLVWSASGHTWAGTGFQDLTLTTPFALPAGQNLLVYYVSNDGSYTGNQSVTWKIGGSMTNGSAYAFADGSMPTTVTSLTTRPVVRFDILGTAYADNSIGLQSIDSPIQLTAIGGIPSPLTVTIRNKGANNIDSAVFNWSINGVLQTPYTFRTAATDTIFWDFEKQITIGSYTPSVSAFDTIVIWVNMPNGVVDTAYLDDTLSTVIYGCTTPLSGTYVVGTDFPTIEQAIQIINLCGASADVTVEIPSGEYTGSFDFANIGWNIDTNTVTFTSQAGDKDSVIINNTTSMTLSEARNFVLKDLTLKFDSTAGIIFAKGSQNILIRDNNVLLDTTTTSFACIGQNANTGLCDNVRICNNYISGGNIGVLMQGNSTTEYETNIIVDSNVITKQYMYAICYTYAEHTTHANVLTSRTSNTGTNWYGVRSMYTKGDITNNRVRQLSTAITTPYGLYVYYHNNGDSVGYDLVANNEVAVNSTSSPYGVYTGYSSVEFLHNSILATGSATARGFYVASTAAGRYVIKANDIVVPQGYPIYLSSITYLSLMDINDNNYFSSNYVGYAGANQTALSSWTATVTTDVNSTMTAPSYIDSTLSLQWSNYTGLTTIVSPKVLNDITGAQRGGTTGKGAYRGLAPVAVDALLAEIKGLSSGQVSGQTDTLSVSLLNGGLTTLTAATIQWKINGVLQTPVSWTGSLALGDIAMVTLGTYTYVPGTVEIEAYLSALGGLTDLNLNNDTVSAEAFICTTGGLSGAYTVGVGGQMESITEALDKIEMCGIGGNLTLNLLTGNYAGNIRLSGLDQQMNGYTLTIQSLSGNPEDVVITSAGNGFVLENSRNIAIKNLTINVINGSYGIQFTNACTNIVVQNLTILSDPTTTSSAKNPVYKSGTGVLDSVFFIGNRFDGGYYGVYFYGGTSSTAFATNIVFDSNVFSNAYYYANFFYYTDFTSFSHNTITSRESNTSTYWYGIRCYYCNGNFVGNKIKQLGASITYPYGVYMYYINTHGNSTGPALFANNTVEVSSPSDYYGMYLYQYRINVINNTIKHNGTSSGYALYVSTASTTPASVLNIKNNIFWATGSSAYPVYFSAAYQTAWNVTNNCQYSMNYVGYAGGVKNTVSAWQAVVTSDTGSVKVLPQFFSADNFDLLDSTQLSTFVDSLVPTDINGYPRVGTTTMGAYHYYSPLSDAYPVEFIDLTKQQVIGDSVSVKVSFVNNGTSNLTSAKINWKVNGVAQTQYNWTGNLAQYEVDTVLLGTTTAVAGAMNVVAYTSLPNNVADQKPAIDTIAVELYGCDSMLHGDYTVGTGGDFATLDEALATVANCGISSATTLSLLENQVLSGTLETALGSNNQGRVLITSANGGKYSITSNASPVLTFDNTENYTLRNLQIGNGTKDVVLNFVGTCKNITIDSCDIVGNPTTTSSTAKTIQYANTSGSGKYLSNIEITNNNISGGYYNVYLYYTHGTNSNMTAANAITFNNNNLTNAYYYGLYSYYYCCYKSINGNKVTSRSSSSAYYGIYSFYYQTIPEMMNNKIKVTTTSTAYGMQLYYYQNYSTTYGSTGPGLLANNEIILKSTSGTMYGVYMYGTSRWDMYNNSVYCQGTSTAYGLYRYTTSTSYLMNIENNNFHIATTGTGYPIYIATATYAASAYGTMNYNNYYSTGANVGYIGSAKTTLAALQTATGQDANSINVNSNFASPLVSLALPDSVLMPCPRKATVLEDLRGYSRGDTTNIGAYSEPPVALDLSLVEINIDGIRSSVAYTPTLTVKNIGGDTITTFSYTVVYNGVAQTPVTKTQVIPTLESYTFDLPSITAAIGNNTIEVYLNSVNAVLDSVRSNDTLNLQFMACPSTLAGQYTVGAQGADFATPAAFFTQLDACGISGDITLAFQDGTYTGQINLANEVQSLGGYGITFTSLNGDSSLVTLSNTATTLILNGNNDVTFKDITISSTSGYAVQFTGSCQDILFTNCQILANATATSSSATCFYKTSSTGVLENLTIVNNLINGGYYGTYLWGASTSTGGYNTIRFDSNIVSNQYYYGCYFYYSNLTSFSHNTILSRASGNITSSWYGYYSYYTNAEIVGNRIENRSASISSPYGIFSYYGGVYNNTLGGPTLIVNNEIKLQASSTGNGIYTGYSISEIVNNSVDISGSGTTSRGIYIYDATNNSMTIKNNMFTLDNGYPVYVTATTNLGLLTFGYNSMYSPTAVAYLGSAVSTLPAWQGLTNDSASVSVEPIYAGQNLEVSNFANYICPRHVNAITDINGISRSAMTFMGCYTFTLPTDPSASLEIVNWTPEAVLNSQKQVEVKIMNVSSATINNVTFGWSVNGVNQTPYTWTATPAVTTFGTGNAVIGSYTVTGTQSVVEVWINNINTTYPNLLADTATANCTVVPLAEFVAPFVLDTVYGLSFDVYTKIVEGTGAAITAPEMTIKSTVNGMAQFLDTVTMVPSSGNVWVASIPQQYYGSNVVFSTVISDTIGNTVTLTDSAYLAFGTGKDSVQVGNGTTTNYQTPVNLFYCYSWTRQLYLGRELKAGSTGGSISKLAWEYAYASSYTSTNQTCYMLAVDDSVLTTGYLDPSVVGASLVWTGSVTWTQGWCEITLDTAFLLPPNKNLMVIWHNNHGTYPGSTYVFNHHTTTLNQTAYAQSDGSFPSGSSGTLSTARPNAKFTIGTDFEPYTGSDLGLMALGSPVNDPDAYCGADYSELSVVLSNLGSNDYAFATDSVVINVEVTGAIQYSNSITLTTDSLLSGKSDTIVIDTLFPIMTAGQYNIKAWVTDSSDQVVYDDTLLASYISDRVSLPLDVDFSNGIPLALRTDIVAGTSDFYVLSDSNAAGTVIPQYSNKMLAFDGTRGSSARLLTRQLDLTGTSNPLIEFWYWHDSNSTAGSNDYTDVRLTFDGGATYTTLFQVTKRNAALDHGWTKYTYDLSQYTQNSCIIVVFESMRMSLPAFDGEQYIDRIRLVSDQDLAVGEMIAPAINACTQTADLEIVLENMTAQAINFASYPTSLQVDITGAITQSYTIPLNSGTLASLAADTITVAPNFNFAAGTYYVYAKLLTAIDNTPANDEMRDTLVVNPELTVAATAVTGGDDMVNCIVAGSKVAQVVDIANSGNMDMEDLVLTLSVSNESGAVVETITDTIFGTFAVNATVSHTFASTYTVPTGGELYNVQVVVAPLCNAAMDFDNIITECVDLSDIEIVAILAPDASSTNCDAVGSTIKVKAQLRNNHPNDDFQNIVIHAEVTANSGASLGSWTETINEIQAGSTLDFEFPQGFTVPNEVNYTVKVYVNNMDGNAGNDTLSATKCTDLGIGEGDVNGISMSQNIPNPAETNARVQYSVPTSGQVVFTLTTVTGQIIYSESVNVESGVHYIDFNTVNLANGIYFYIMDFNGQRLVKKMSVRN